MKNSSFRRPGMLTMSIALLLPWLAGCAISTPYPRIADAPSGSGDDRVVLVLTRVVVDAGQRAEFDRQTRKVIRSMGAQPGLIGYAARRQLFGNEGWTMSVWASDEARAQFARSAVHREAIARSAPALVSVELKRLTLARKDVPADWSRALEMLADPEDLRNYRP